MAIQVTAILPNPNVPDLAIGGLHVLSGIVECFFEGNSSGNVIRDTLSFTVGPVNLGIGGAPAASCVVSPASIAFDGAVNNALWAVDSAQVTNYVNADRGSGTADLQVVANLAVRGATGMILRVNYLVFNPV